MPSASHQGIRAMRLHRFVLIGAMALALGLSACASFPTANPGPSYPVINAPPHSTAIPDAPPFTVAAWPSNSAPGPREPLNIYVSFRQSGHPVRGASVSLILQGANVAHAYGPFATNAAGYAGFQLGTNVGPPNRPVFIQVSVSYQGKTYRATTDITPQP